MNINQAGNRSNGIWQGLLYFQKAVMIVTSIAVTCIIFLSVILRYIFKTDLYGIEEIVVMVAFWLYFMGSSYGSFEKSQIAADLLHLYLKSARSKQIANLITSSLTTLLGLLVNYWAVQFFIWGLQMDARSAIYRLPMVIPQSAVLVGFTLMSLYNVVYLIDDVKCFITTIGPKAEKKPE
ncbi:TRAP transporter small permease [Candidatus Formimonas warabiya]|uniref:Tripartite ATP-independent periplasmic transporters DctQ component domain-containing protein n=1 Tax=Formimonas warabiya TaxID=1761012 RepID=A0A3G1KX18_FORW1|nr:TRAP transporter small permease subunit [Candidatus Formimonas warabiya]ATW27024.1 hypothetical protein DCMF_21680 [Candidatus Formimonas warabiya]